MAGYIGNKSSVTLVDGITKNGGTLEGDLSFGDNDKAIFGDADELQIYNDGTHSVISESGPGAFKITADAGLWIQSNNGEFRINTDANGAVALYYDNAVKLATTSTGIDVTGEVTTTGNVGIGTTPSTDWRTSFNTTATQVGLTGSLFNLDVSTGDRRCMVSSNAILNASGDFQHILEGHATIYSQQSGTHRWYTAPSASAGATASATERMRIDSSGSVGIGKSPDSDAFLSIDYAYGAKNGIRLRDYSYYSSQHALIIENTDPNVARNHNSVHFIRNGNFVGAIQIKPTSTSYNTSSDYRLKENVVDLTGASARVNQLDVKRFNFIADETNTAVDGFLAHEVATVVPEAITGTKDAMKDEEYEVTPATGDIYTPSTDAYVDDDGNDIDAVDEVIHSADAEQPETLEDGQQWRETTAAVMGTRSVPDYQGIDQSKLVPLLTAALQEALTEIASLKTRVEALEA